MKDNRFDTAMLLLRAGAGLSLVIIFGIPKLKLAAEYIRTGHWGFVDWNRQLGLPAPALVAYFQTLNESVVAFVVACGLWTRTASCILIAGFVGASLCSLKAHEQAWWLTAAYLALIFTVIALVGPGRFSLDSFFQRRKARIV